MAQRNAPVLILSGLSFVIGALVLVGWSVDDHVLVSVVPGQVRMKANTAVCFLLGGLALASVPPAASSGRTGRLGDACAMLVVGLASATLLEYLLGRSFGIDELLFRDPVRGGGSSHPGRMAPNSAFNFLLLGVSFALARRPSRRAAQVAQGLAFATAFVTLLAVLGYVYRAQVLVGLFSLNRMALHTIVGFFAVAGGVLVVTCDRAWVAELLQTRSARAVASRLLPAALVVPTCVGAGVLTGYRMGLYDAAFSACLMAAAEVTSFTLLAWVTVRALNAFEEEKAVARVDALTGLRARRGFVIEATEKLEASRAAGRSAIIAFVDLDGMKQVNDQHGHHVGDAALVEMASVLRSIFRDSDVIARLGGDEFAIFCEGADAALGETIVGRLASKLEAINTLPGRRYRLACSAGYAVAEPATQRSLDDLLTSADAAMYRVKRARGAARKAVAESPLAFTDVLRELAARRERRVSHPPSCPPS